LGRRISAGNLVSAGKKKQIGYIKLRSDEQNNKINYLGIKYCVLMVYILSKSIAS